MPFPKIDACIICEAVRPEQFNKHILLGFFGVTPHVTVIYPDISKQALLCFVFSGGSDHTTGGRYDLAIEIKNPSGSVISNPSTSAPINNALLQSGNMPMNVFFAFQGVFGMEGTFQLSLLVNGVEHYRTRFEIRQGVLQ